MNSIDLQEVLERSGAVLHGHFKLTSGKHSDTYFEKFRILEQPAVLSTLCEEIANHFRGQNIEFVAGPTTGGIIIAFEVARLLKVESRYIETENGVKTFRRHATISEGARVLVVDDVLTTGLSLKESAAAVRTAGGQPVAYAVLIDRSETFEPELPLFSAFKVEAKSYFEDHLPDWLSAIPVTKPGTRK